VHPPPPEMDRNKRTELHGLDPDDVGEMLERAVRQANAPLEAAMRELRRAQRAIAGIYDKEGLAEMLGIEPRTVEKWCRERGLPKRKIGRQPVFLLHEVVAWVEAHPLDVEEGRRDG